MVATWLGLATLASPFVQGNSVASKDAQITVRNARRGKALPERYASRIEALANARDVTYLDLQIVTCNGAGDTVTLNALGGQGVDRDLMQAGVNARSQARWKADPLGILMTAKDAARCGWRAGMGVQPADIRNRPLPIHISGIFTTKPGERTGYAYAHFAYVNRTAPFAGEHQVLAIYVYAANPRASDALAARIDHEFAHDDPPVQASPNTITQNAWSRFGKVQYLLIFVMGAIFLCSALVLVSVLAHAAAQRRAQMGLLRVFGFPRRLLWSAWLLEGWVILLLGTLLGTATGLAGIDYLSTAASVLQIHAPPSWVWLSLPVGLLVLLVAALVAPTWVVMRVRPIDCRNL